VLDGGQRGDRDKATPAAEAARTEPPARRCGMHLPMPGACRYAGAEDRDRIFQYTGHEPSVNTRCPFQSSNVGHNLRPVGHHQDACAVAYADDSYMTAKLYVA